MPATQQNIVRIAEMIIEHCIYGDHEGNPREVAERINQNEGWEIPSSRSVKRTRIFRLNEAELQQAYDLAITFDGEQQLCLEWQREVGSQAKQIACCNPEDVTTWHAPIEFIIDRLNANLRWIDNRHITLFIENLLPLVGHAERLPDIAHLEDATTTKQNAVNAGKYIQQAIACLYTADSILRLLILSSDPPRTASAIAKDYHVLYQEYASCQQHLRDTLFYLKWLARDIFQLKTPLYGNNSIEHTTGLSSNSTGVLLSFEKYSRQGKESERT